MNKFPSAPSCPSWPSLRYASMGEVDGVQDTMRVISLSFQSFVPRPRCADEQAPLDSNSIVKWALKEGEGGEGKKYLNLTVKALD